MRQSRAISLGPSGIQLDYYRTMSSTAASAVVFRGSDVPQEERERERTTLMAIASIGSVIAIGSIGSIASAFNIGSIASLFSVGSIGSVFSVGSIFSIKSTCSILSVNSKFSVLSKDKTFAFRNQEYDPKEVAQVALNRVKRLARR